MTLLTITSICFWPLPGDLEYWDEVDSDLDADFALPSSANEPPTPLQGHGPLAQSLSPDQHAIIWWVIAFTCVFQTLHSLPSRAVAWLLKFLGSLLGFLGRYSKEIATIASHFPSTLYQRNEYLREKLILPSVRRYVVCPTCHSLYDFEQCLDKRGTQMLIKSCKECLSSRKRVDVPLLKEVVTSTGNRKYYPYLVYPYSSLVSSLRFLFSRPGFYHNCEKWRKDFKSDSSLLSDVYDGKVWKDFLQFEGRSFLEAPNSIAFMLNIDWFQPFKHIIYSIGVIYLAIMNLPRSLRFKRENIIIIGLIPGPSEPSLHMNTYLTPLVSDLLMLWDGVSFVTHDCGAQVIRCALLCIGCDLPAGRKVCGFLSYTANLGCSRCYCDFGTGTFGVQNYSGFNRANWSMRTDRSHRANVDKTLACSSKTARERKERELGCRYSCLLQLPYFNAVRMLTIDPMHNLYLGTAKYIFKHIWCERGMIDKDSIQAINQRISSVVVPPEVKFGRLPACMEHTSSLTAEQWMLWVNYYSLYCLYEVIPAEDLECWRHFVLASRLLCKRQLSQDDIKVADALLMQFCRRFEVLYGPTAVTPNIYLHAHLVECVRDYGPMSSFWLFSFERFNGILGDQPTNNRSIELQLITRFLQDNAHVQLLSSVPSAASDITAIFSQVVLDHAHSFTSTRHLDNVPNSHCNSEIVPAMKYTISSFSEHELGILSNVYQEVFPSVLDPRQCQTLYIPRSYRKMLSLEIKGQKVTSGKYVWARSVYEFPCSSASSICTVFTDPRVRPAKIDHFCFHSIQVSESEFVTHAFAVVSWPMHHPLQHCIGKPFVVWCASLYESYAENCILPVQNIVSLSLTAQQVFEEENVLITVPLIV